MTEQTSRGVQSVDRAFSVLDALERFDGAGVTELHEELGLSIGSTHAYLSTLEANNAVVQENGKYHIGFGLLDHAGYARDKLDFYHYARENVRELADKTGELAAVSIEEHGENVYLGVEKGRQASNIGIRVGTRLPMHCLGSGKAILAELPEERVREILASTALEPVTEQTITDDQELLRELEAIRQRGIAFDDEERIEGMRAVAAAIVDDETGEVHGAITVSGPKTRIRGDRFSEELPQTVENTAQEITVNVSYS